MQSTGQTSIQASQPVQLSARMTANSLGSFFLALPAPFAMTTSLVQQFVIATRSVRLEADQPAKAGYYLTPMPSTLSIFLKRLHFNKGRLRASGILTLAREDRRRT